MVVPLAQLSWRNSLAKRSNVLSIAGLLSGLTGVTVPRRAHLGCSNATAALLLEHQRLEENFALL
jgi:hypothetical protein